MTYFTENGDVAYGTSGSQCLDFFTTVTRNATVEQYLDKFNKCWLEDKETAIQLLLNLRDVRGGKGEKLIPQVIMVHLSESLPKDEYKEILVKFLDYGYYKDLLRIVEIRNRLILNGTGETRVEMKETGVEYLYKNNRCVEFELLAEQLLLDCDNYHNENSVSLCAKWLPNEGTHFANSPVYAVHNICKIAKLTFKKYRIKLSILRKKINVIEGLLCTGQFDLIDFSKIPARAMKNYSDMFGRHCNSKGVESNERELLNQRYLEFLSKLNSGETKVKVSGIQPHEIVQYFFTRQSYTTEEKDILYENMWKEMVTQIKESGSLNDVVAVCDVSSSMAGLPMQVSIALGLFVSECSNFSERVITFSENPSWHTIQGSTLRAKVRSLSGMGWGGSTNMLGVFNLILNEAISKNLEKDKMVKKLFIFTDMQFNQTDSRFNTTFEVAKKNFNDAGYELPTIICWNLRSSSTNTLACSKHENNHIMLSGFSQQMLKNFMTNSDLTDINPYKFMKEVLDKYECPHSIKNSHSHQLVLRHSFDLFTSAISKSAIKKCFKKNK